MNNPGIYRPESDGIDHINIYSRAKTPAGKLLSNFAHTPFTIYGILFESVEGFYQSMLFDDDDVRAIIAGTFGKDAKSWEKKSTKKVGDPIRTWNGRIVKYCEEEFYDEVRKAIKVKVLQNESVLEALVSTGSLPLTHYYVIWGRPIIPKGGSTFLEDYFTCLREELRLEMKLQS